MIDKMDDKQSYVSSDLESHSDNHDIYHDESSSHDVSDSWSETGTGIDPNNDIEEEKVPQSREMKMINIIRSFVILFMVTFAMIAANSVFVYVVIKEENTYEKGLKDYSQKLIDNFYGEIEHKMNTARTLSTIFTSQAYSSGATWPMVSFAEFGAQCAIPRQVGRVSGVSFAPLVTHSQREAWETYASEFDFVAKHDRSMLEDPMKEEVPTKFYINHNRSADDGIYRVIEGRPVTDSITTDVYFPIWQSTPLSSNASEIMFHHRSNPVREQGVMTMLQTSAGACSDVLLHGSRRTDYAFFSNPRNELYYPIWDTLHREDIVGALGLEFRWETFLDEALKDSGVQGSLVVVLESSCGGNYSYEVTTEGAFYLGLGERYDDLVESKDTPQSSNYSEFAQRLQDDKSHSTSTSTSTSTSNNNTTSNQTFTSCDFRITVYPSQEFRDSYMTDTPLYLKLLVAFAFIFTISVFVIYDCIVDSYQKRMIESAEKTHAIVRALFPQNVRDRLMRVTERARDRRSSAAGNTTNAGKSVASKDNWTYDSTPSSKVHYSTKFRLTNMLQGGGSLDNSQGSSGELDEPLADLYPEATILFADIAGFTAWSSGREPAQVFTLLETLYGAMDRTARKLGVFKVETIGDCYVAATGLPNARSDHAEVMVKFARSCLQKNRQLLTSLEATLGPGTAELGMRTGIHSGSVTAGILRGEKSRFQLFGDAMNTASRIESTGQKNKIQLSQSVVDYLERAGKGHWVVPREDKVQAKGKGELQTYWLKLGSDSANSDSVGDAESCKGDAKVDSGDPLLGGNAGRRRSTILGNNILDSVLWKTETNSTDERLVDWNTDVLMSLLTNVVSSRDDYNAPEQAPSVAAPTKDGIPLNELAPVIHMHEFAPREERRKAKLPETVRSELREYVVAIASAYQRHGFHNFEHASHVALSASKLLKRIDMAENEEGITMEELHEQTYGITSDPLLKFAVVFASLVHDVGHTGVSNGRLAVESPEVAERYENKCIAEQRSVDTAWELLMLPMFENLRAAMFGNQRSEEHRFRQLLVNCVLATDIFDKELTTQRKQRWAKAFQNDFGGSDSLLLLTPEEIDCRATVVVEHIIQASDVSHTMQHWHVFKKWNNRLFQEMYAAYQAGRMEKDPSIGWYKSELGFFDNYIIPLALKLKECGVFGSSGDEYYKYAIENRDEWASRGEEECQQMLEMLKGAEEDDDDHGGYAAMTTHML